MSSGHWQTSLASWGWSVAPHCCHIVGILHPPLPHTYTHKSSLSLLCSLYIPPLPQSRRLRVKGLGQALPLVSFQCVLRAKLNPSCFRDFPFDSQGPFLLSIKPGSQQIKDFGFQNYCFWCGLQEAILKVRKLNIVLFCSFLCIPVVPILSPQGNASDLLRERSSEKSVAKKSTRIAISTFFLSMRNIASDHTSPLISTLTSELATDEVK